MPIQTLAMTEQREVDTPLGPINVRSTGSGPAVLCVHGAFVDGRVWDSTATLLAGHATVLLPDLPQGAHRHPVPDRQLLTPHGIADALARILTAHEVDRAVVVGNDNGGAMSQVFAAEHPDRTAGLVPAGCEVLEHFPPPAFAPFVYGARWPLTLGLFARALRWSPLLARQSTINIFTRRGFGRSYVEEILHGLITDPEIRKDLAAFILSLDPQILLAASSRLGHVRHYAEVVWPRHDVFFPPSDGRRVAALLGTDVTWADHARTFVPVDRPDLVADAVCRILVRREWRATDS